MKTQRYAWGFLLLLTVLCSPAGAQPNCPYTGEPADALSAGCLLVSGGKMLVVEFAGGAVSPPGGKADPGESARCAAIRETWEETGLAVDAAELIHVFESGFHLYRCHAKKIPGELKTRMPGEINATYFLPSDRFGQATWRFPEDMQVFLDALSTSSED